VGNKIDIASNGRREVSSQDGESFKGEINAKKYFETSAKQGDSVEKVFKLLTLEILKSSGKI
jgi:hypothetical protein